MLRWETIREGQKKAREQRLARETPLSRELPLRREVAYQPLLPYFQQEEDEQIAKDYQLRCIKKWFFGYYKHCTDEKKKLKLIDSYNKLYNHKGLWRGRERE